MSQKHILVLVLIHQTLLILKWFKPLDHLLSFSFSMTQNIPILSNYFHKASFLVVKLKCFINSNIKVFVSLFQQTKRSFFFCVFLCNLTSFIHLSSVLLTDGYFGFQNLFKGSWLNDSINTLLISCNWNVLLVTLCYSLRTKFWHSLWDFIKLWSRVSVKLQQETGRKTQN